MSVKKYYWSEDGMVEGETLGDYVKIEDYKSLREALERYGRHEEDCHYECGEVECTESHCTCGLDKALKGEP